MRTTFRRHVQVAVSSSLLLLGTLGATGQGFVNLNFEQANVPPTPFGGWGDFVDPSLAFPGWTMLPNTYPYYTVSGYNTISIGASAVILIGPNYPNATGYTSLQGSYSVLLQYFGIGGHPGLSQTGLVPSDAKSITILSSGVGVAINGSGIPLVSIPGGRLAGDISAYAGQTVQLSIHTGGFFDDIRFSLSTIPEPTTLSLFSTAYLALAYQFSKSRMRHLNKSELKIRV